MLLGHTEQLQELLSVVDRSNLLAEDEVENQAEGEGQGECEKHEHKGDGYSPRPYHQPVSGTDGLRDDLSKDDDGNGGGDDGIDSSREDRVQQDRESAVHQHIA